MKMQTFAVVVLVLVGFQLCSGMRMQKRGDMKKTTKNDAKTTWDVLMCDKMCMQCPDGSNILITRQKSTMGNALSLGSGLFTFGWGIPVVNQLAGCSKIGFEVWKDHKKVEDQPLETDTWFGVLFPHSGLEKLRNQTNTKTSARDEEALEECEKLSDAYLWQAVHGAFSFKSGHTRQQELARKCLAHSRLCNIPLGGENDGESLGDDASLEIGRFNPFAHESMCSAPPEVDDSTDGNGEDTTPDNSEESEANKPAPSVSDVAKDATLSTETVEEAGKLLDEAKQNGGYDADDSGDDVGKVSHTLCRSEEQKARCAKDGIDNPSACKDRCCLDVCKFYGKKFASSLATCTGTR